MKKSMCENRDVSTRTKASGFVFDYALTRKAGQDFEIIIPGRGTWKRMIPGRRGKTNVK